MLPPPQTPSPSNLFDAAPSPDAVEAPVPRAPLARVAAAEVPETAEWPLQMCRLVYCAFGHVVHRLFRSSGYLVIICYPPPCLHGVGVLEGSPSNKLLWICSPALFSASRRLRDSQKKCSKTARVGPRRPRRPQRWSQECPRRPRDSPTVPQDGLMKAQGAAKTS